MMKTSRIAAMVACLMPALGGCSGIYYASEAKPTNLAPPGELRFNAAAISYQNDLTTLVGTIAVYNKAEKSLQVLEPVANAFDPRTRPVVETVNQTLYKSVITSGFATDVPLISAALKDAGGQDLEVTVTDEAHGMVPSYSPDIINHLGSRYRPTNAQEEIVYVTDVWQRRFNAALLTAVPHSAWTANTGVVVYNTKTYARTDSFKDGRYLTVTVVPFSNPANGLPALANAPLPTSAVAVIKPQIANPYAYTWRGDHWRHHGWHGNGYGCGYGYGDRCPRAK